MKSHLRFGTCTATELGGRIEWREESSASELEAVPLAGAAAAGADEKCAPYRSCSGGVPDPNRLEPKNA